MWQLLHSITKFSGRLSALTSLMWWQFNSVVASQVTHILSRSNTNARIWSYNEL